MAIPSAVLSPTAEAGDRLLSGVVQAADADAVLVSSSMGLFRACRAEGCLLAPAKGDTVLIALIEDEAWVLSVLRRRKAPASVLLPEDTAVRAGRLNVEATACVEMKAPGISLEGSDVRLAAKRTAGISAGLLSLSGSLLLQGFASVQSCAHRVFERFVKKTASYDTVTEKVEGLVERQAGRVREDIRTSYRMRAENADVKAQEQLDLDASHIKVG